MKLKNMKNNIIKWGDFDYSYSDEVFTPKKSSLYFLDEIENNLNLLSNKQNAIIDICCGIGAIGISAYKKFSDRFDYFIGIDIEKAAIDNCNKNIKYHNVNGVAKLWKAGDKIPITSEGLAVCNPPFLPIEYFKKNSTTKIEHVASDNMGLEVTLKCFDSLIGTNIILILKSLNKQIPYITQKVRNNYTLVNQCVYKIENNYEIAFTTWEPNH